MQSLSPEKDLELADFPPALFKTQSFDPPDRNHVEQSALFSHSLWQVKTSVLTNTSTSAPPELIWKSMQPDHAKSLLVSN